MPTFGKTAIGATATAFEGEKETVCKFKPNISAKVSKLTVYIKDGTVAGTVKMKAVLYADDGAGKPGALVGEGTEVTYTKGAGSKWVDLPFAAALTVPEGNVWIGLIFSGGTGIMELVYDELAETERYFQARAYALGATNPGAMGSFDKKEISCYATFTYSAPVLTKPADQISGQGAEAALKLSATNAEKYSATGLPKGLTLNAATGLITGTATTREEPTVSVTVTGLEGSGTDTKTFKWLIARADGVKTIGPISVNRETEKIALNKVTMSVATKLKKLVVYLTEGGSAGTVKLKALVYADEAGKPGALIAEGAEVTYKNGEGAKWLDLPLGTEPETAQGVVWIGYKLEGNANVAAFHYVEESPATVDRSKPWKYATAAPNPWTAGEGGELNPNSGGGAFDNHNFSIYAVYSIAPPAFTKPADQTNTVGIPINEVWLVGTNVESWSVTGLPLGLNLNPATGRISGAPQSVQAASVTVTAKGESATIERTFTWNVVSVATAGTFRGYTPFSPPPSPPGASTSPFNRPVGQSRVLSNSALIISWLFASNTEGVGGAHSRNQFPTVFASNTDPQVEILRKTPPAEETPGSYFHKKVIRLPENAKVQSNGDKHLQIVLCPNDCAALGLPEGTTCDLWHAGGEADPSETLVLEAGAPKKLKCDSCGKGNITTSLVGPPGGYSVAAGFDLNAGVIRGPEFQASLTNPNAIQHALVVLVHDVKEGTFVYPADHTDGANKEANSPAMGQRLWLEATDAEILAANLPHPYLIAVAKALAKYGGYIEDTGGLHVSLRTENDAMYVYAGAPGYMARAGEEQGLVPDSEGVFFDYSQLRSLLEAKLRAVAAPAPSGVEPPLLTKPADQSTTGELAVSLQIHGSNVTTYEAIGLPGGLSINAGTGLITGTPSGNGTFNVKIIGKGTESEVETTFVWTVSFVPVAALAFNREPTPQTPHLAFPVGVSGGEYRTTDQDSDADVASCIDVILSYEQGARRGSPNFGLPPSALFSPGSPIVAAVRAAVARSEDRARLDVELSDQTLKDSIARVQVGYETERSP